MASTHTGSLDRNKKSCIIFSTSLIEKAYSYYLLTKNNNNRAMVIKKSHIFKDLNGIQNI